MDFGSFVGGRGRKGLRAPKKCDAVEIIKLGMALLHQTGGSFKATQATARIESPFHMKWKSVDPLKNLAELYGVTPQLGMIWMPLPRLYLALIIIKRF